MKFTSKILAGLFVVLVGGVLSSNIIMKREYDRVNKSDIYWTYDNVLEQPFKFLKITGGNGTKIAYEQNAASSVRILREWKNWLKGGIKAHVSNDTLYIDFDYKPENLYSKFWMENITTVRVFSPELLSVEGHNTNFEMFKLKQKNMRVSMTGRSKFELESMLPAFDSLTIFQKDSSVVVFEMSPDYKPAAVTDHPATVKFLVRNGGTGTFTPPPVTVSREAMSINSVNAELEGYSLLDLGHAQIKSLELKIADSSAIILSGSALKKKMQ